MIVDLLTKHEDKWVCRWTRRAGDDNEERSGYAFVGDRSPHIGDDRTKRLYLITSSTIESENIVYWEISSWSEDGKHFYRRNYDFLRKEKRGGEDNFRDEQCNRLMDVGGEDRTRRQQYFFIRHKHTNCIALTDIMLADRGLTFRMTYLGHFYLPCRSYDSIYRPYKIVFELNGMQPHLISYLVGLLWCPQTICHVFT